MDAEIKSERTLLGYLKRNLTLDLKTITVISEVLKSEKSITLNLSINSSNSLQELSDKINVLYPELSKTTTHQIVSPKQNQKIVFIKHGNKLIKVNLDSILYAHVDSKNYCSIITVEGKKFSVRYSIQKLHTQLGRPNFVQTHRSYIVNLEKVTAFHESDHTIEVGSHHIPIGRTFKERVYQKLSVI